MFPDIDFLEQARLQNTSSMKINEEKIVVVKIICGDQKMEEFLSTKLLISYDDLCFSK